MHLVQSQTCLLWTHMISGLTLDHSNFLLAWVPAPRPPKSYYLTWSLDSVKIINNHSEKCFHRSTNLIIRIADLKL